MRTLKRLLAATVAVLLVVAVQKRRSYSSPGPKPVVHQQAADHHLQTGKAAALLDRATATLSDAARQLTAAHESIQLAHRGTVAHSAQTWRGTPSRPSWALRIPTRNCSVTLFRHLAKTGGSTVQATPLRLSRSLDGHARLSLCLPASQRQAIFRRAEQLGDFFYASHGSWVEVAARCHPIMPHLALP